MDKEIKSTINDPLKGRIIRESKTIRKKLKRKSKIRKIFKRIKDWSINKEIIREISKNWVNKDLRYNSDDIKRNKENIIFTKKCIQFIESKLLHLKETLKELESIRKNCENWKNVLSDLENNG